MNRHILDRSFMTAFLLILIFGAGIHMAAHTKPLHSSAVERSGRVGP